jgi:hypothetical protein
MKARLTYIPIEMADKFDDFIILKSEEVLDAVRARSRDYKTLSILKLLYQLRGDPMTFSDLYTSSKIRMKRSFLNYLRFCIDYDFIRKEYVGQYAIYSLTERGRTMLDLFIRKSN